MSARYCTFLTAIIFSIFIVSGCGSAGNPTVPSDPLSQAQNASSHPGRSNLGLWQFRIDPDNKTVDVYPLRTVMTHMNGLAFMEPPAGALLGIDQVVDFQPGEMTLDIKLTHPYASLKKTAAFDVCGILISHGSMDFPLFTKYKWPGTDVVHLKNPDGYTRWWNPIEFPANEALPHTGYVDGLLGTPNETGQFTATLNPYKYFATDLTDPEGTLDTLDHDRRGVFEPGTSCIRRYVIGFTPGSLVFNYAVDANWFPPVPSGPGGDVIIPDDFPASANRPEPYYIEVKNINNTLAYDTSAGSAEGGLAFSVYVYDWFEPEGNKVCPYAQDNEIQGFCNPTPSEVGDGYAAFNIDCFPALMDGPGDFMMWLSVENDEMDYQGALPFEKISVYFQTTFNIAEK